MGIPPAKHVIQIKEKTVKRDILFFHPIKWADDTA